MKKTKKVSWDKLCTPKEEGGLGFHDLKALNLTLLAKQERRLQTNTSYLVYRVLKDKYFPDSDFLKAKLGSHPSYAWRSILATLNIVRKGCKWQVGNGASIDIWTDKWLNGSSTFKVLTRMNTLPDQSLVSLLIDLEIAGWHDQLMRQVFIPVNVQSILSIPLSVHMPQDRLVCAFTPKGNLIVHSAYKIVVVVFMETRMEGTLNGENHKSFWRRLWGLNLLNKMKSLA
ncbi:hypothetical protein SO802_017788 [Lithocarpus litseifolius]|uniref:Uncharacterized protein n=1 Tax=Lithocarpus litseifolius TaxID=425828 RepID=A0AAW2CMD5_9ROSI